MKVQIIDKDTLVPIRDAAVYCIERPNVIAMSDINGNSRISKEKERIRFFPFGPWNVTPPDCTLTIIATGYEPVVFDKIRSLEIDKGILFMKRK